MNIRVFDFSGTVTGTTDQGITETRTKKGKAPLPMLYFGGEINIPQAPLSLRAELKTIPISKFKYHDFTGEFRIIPIKNTPPLKNAYISIGYRTEKLKIDNIKDVFADARNSGPFAIMGVKF